MATAQALMSTGAPAAPPATTEHRPWRQVELWCSAIAFVLIAAGSAILGPDPVFGTIGVLYLVAAVLMWRGGRRLAMTGTILALPPSALVVAFLGVSELAFLATHPVS